MLARWLKDEYKDKRGEDVDLDHWPRRFPKDIPQQHNGCDCGMFAILFADYAVRAAGSWAVSAHGVCVWGGGIYMQTVTRGARLLAEPAQADAVWPAGHRLLQDQAGE